MPMGTIETFDHTADVGMRVMADSLEDLFRSAAEGLFDYIVTNRAEVRPTVLESVDLRADEPAELLVTWLNDLIFRGETRHRLYSVFDVQVADDGRALHGRIGGEAIDPERHQLDHEVKAVTHHGLTLHKREGRWLAEFILDI